MKNILYLLISLSAISCYQFNNLSDVMSSDKTVENDTIVMDYSHNVLLHSVILQDINDVYYSLCRAGDNHYPNTSMETMIRISYDGVSWSGLYDEKYSFLPNHFDFMNCHPDLVSAFFTPNDRCILFYRVYNDAEKLVGIYSVYTDDYFKSFSEPFKVSDSEVYRYPWSNKCIIRENGDLVILHHVMYGTKNEVWTLISPDDGASWNYEKKIIDDPNNTKYGEAVIRQIDNLVVILFRGAVEYNNVYYSGIMMISTDYGNTFNISDEVLTDNDFDINSWNSDDNYCSFINYEGMENGSNPTGAGPNPLDNCLSSFEIIKYKRKYYIAVIYFIRTNGYTNQKNYKRTNITLFSLDNYMRFGYTGIKPSVYETVYVNDGAYDVQNTPRNDGNGSTIYADGRITGVLNDRKRDGDHMVFFNVKRDQLINLIDKYED